MNPTSHFGSASRIAALALCMAALSASAAEVWQSLPPTPQLPGGRSIGTSRPAARGFGMPNGQDGPRQYPCCGVTP